MHRLLKLWRPITMEVALELLDYHYADEEVRALAVKRIEKISNCELKNFLLQLVQVSCHTLSCIWYTALYMFVHCIAIVRILEGQLSEISLYTHISSWHTYSNPPQSPTCNSMLVQVLAIQPLAEIADSCDKHCLNSQLPTSFDCYRTCDFCLT